VGLNYLSTRFVLSSTANFLLARKHPHPVDATASFFFNPFRSSLNTKLMTFFAFLFFRTYIPTCTSITSSFLLSLLSWDGDATHDSLGFLALAPSFLIAVFLMFFTHAPRESLTILDLIPTCDR